MVKKKKKSTKKRVEHPIMKCGHRAQGVDQKNNPVCVICFPSKDSLTVDKFQYGNMVRLKLAKCSYCNNVAPSSHDLPFFTPKKDKKYDDYYCGCKGLD
jgi:hypothetical protein